MLVNGTRRISVLVAAFALLAVPVAPARADDQAPATLGGRRVNSWAARSTSGLTLGGTFTATEDPATGAVTGTWTLVDARGRPAMRGAWSAAKAASGWSGNWRAVVEGRRGEYSGSWNAKVDLKPTAKFADVFTKAVEAAVSGTWRAAGQSGAWTIQAYN